MHDNACQHSSEFTMAFLDELDWFIFQHPAYLPDMAPSDFWLFLCLSDFLGGQYFANELQVKQAAAKFFCDCLTSFCATGIERLVDRYKKCPNSNMVIMLKNRLSHVVFVVSFSWQLVHIALRCVVGIFTFGMTLVYIFWQICCKIYENLKLEKTTITEWYAYFDSRSFSLAATNYKLAPGKYLWSSMCPQFFKTSCHVFVSD